jgi:hypothetical protein
MPCAAEGHDASAQTQDHDGAQKRRKIRIYFCHTQFPEYGSHGRKQCGEGGVGAPVEVHEFHHVRRNMPSRKNSVRQAGMNL